MPLHICFKFAGQWELVEGADENVFAELTSETQQFFENISWQELLGRRIRMVRSALVSGLSDCDLLILGVRFAAIGVR